MRVYIATPADCNASVYCALYSAAITFETIHSFFHIRVSSDG